MIHIPKYYQQFNIIVCMKQKKVTELSLDSQHILLWRSGLLDVIESREMQSLAIKTRSHFLSKTKRLYTHTIKHFFFFKSGLFFFQHKVKCNFLLLQYFVFVSSIYKCYLRNCHSKTHPGTKCHDSIIYRIEVISDKWLFLGSIFQIQINFQNAIFLEPFGVIP